MKSLILAAVSLVTMTLGSANADNRLKVLIVDGQNNHDWKSSTPVLKTILEECGRFDVTVATAPHHGSTPDAWNHWGPAFTDFNVVLSNYNGDEWPADVKSAFLDYVRNGGGFVSYHAADNSFPSWKEYNEMIGVGGWYGRNEKSGPKIYWQDGKVVHDTSPGAGGHHGQQHPFDVEIRDTDHPITKGLPLKWLHAKDELYDSLRGPAENVTVLATAFSDRKFGGTGRHEPMLMAITYGKGRIFHDVLGHAAYSMQDQGFKTTLARGCEWAATGTVTLPPTPAGSKF